MGLSHLQEDSLEDRPTFRLSVYEGQELLHHAGYQIPISILGHVCRHCERTRRGQALRGLSLLLLCFLLAVIYFLVEIRFYDRTACWVGLRLGLLASG